MKTFFISSLGLFSHHAMAHEGSILAPGHQELLALALMALGILLATIALAIERIYPAIEKSETLKTSFMKWHHYFVLTHKPNKFREHTS